MSVAWFAQMRVAEGSVVRANVGTRLEQCANGTSGTVDCTGSAWTRGDLNRNDSLYREGDFVPFRTTITGLTTGGTYTLQIGYHAVESGLHAYDYLGSFDASKAPGQLVVPCDGVAGTAGPHACGTGSVPGPPSTLDVPIDTNTHFLSGGQLPGVFSAWGGQLTHAAYVSPTPINVSTPGTVIRLIDVTFAADGDTVVLAWGGHLASNLNWGAGNTFLGNHSGASYHMLLNSINGASTGNQDLSIHADVLASAPAVSTQVNPSSVAVGDTVTDVASLGGTSGPQAGSVAFFVCGPGTTAPDCTTGGTLAEVSPVIVSSSRAHHRTRRHRVHGRRPRAVSTGSASGIFTPDTAGVYCFRVEYTPAAGAQYSPTSHTNTTTECFRATLPTLSVTKSCVPGDDPGRFDLLIDGTTVLADAACGATTGPITVSVGTHVVSEAAGTGTSLADYTTTIGGDCGTGGSVTVAAGDTKVCTISNVRTGTPHATLTVNKVCDPTTDDGRFNIYVDTTRFADVPCGGTTGAISVAVGLHTVSEAGGTNTNLDDYTSTIGGACTDGSITLVANQSATCTITNVRKPPPPITITVNKACMPADDSGRFNLTIDGDIAGSGANVGCGGSTGPVVVGPGLHIIGETGAGGTDLSDYTTIIGGDCTTGGSVLVAPGDQATCTITNVRNPQPFAILTVNKICVPASDGGLFNLFVGSHVAPDEPCGGSLGPVAVSVGTHQVGETAGTGTNLAHYTTTIGGDCAGNGSITLAAGQSAICTITNALNPAAPTATIDVKKVCVPATAKHRFTLRLDEQLLPELGCGQSTGPMTVSTGLHVIDEVRAGTNPADYETAISGDCAATGLITLAAHEHATCTVTNTRRSTTPVHPPTLCNTLAATPRTLIVGQSGTILAHLTAGGKPVLGARVTLTGLSAFGQRYTSADGTVRFSVTPSTAGTFRLETQRQFGCRSAARDHVAAITLRRKPPAFTG